MIRDLVKDIYSYLDIGDDDDPLSLPCLHGPYKNQINHSGRVAPTNTDPLYASEYGDKCARRVWYKRNKPECGAKLAPYVRMKFMYGDAIEELLLSVAENCGHAVSHQQERCVLENSSGKELLTGRMDAIIDGHVVDVKSMSTFAFNKYANLGLSEDNDTFGYRWQLAFYHYYAVEQEWVSADATPFILGMDKTLGHLSLIEVDLPTSTEVASRAAATLHAVRDTSTLPPRGYTDKPDGVSGNRRLDIACSYCAFKKECWPGLRTFMYSKGPVDMTHVEKEPRVTEIG